MQAVHSSAALVLGSLGEPRVAPGDDIWVRARFVVLLQLEYVLCRSQEYRHSLHMYTCIR